MIVARGLPCYLPVQLYYHVTLCYVRNCQSDVEKEANQGYHRQQISGSEISFLCGRQVANKHFFFPVATANMMEKSGRQKVSIKFLLYSEARKHEDQFTAIWPISSSSHLVLFWDRQGSLFTVFKGKSKKRKEGKACLVNTFIVHKIVTVKVLVRVWTSKSYPQEITAGHC